MVNLCSPHLLYLLLAVYINPLWIYMCIFCQVRLPHSQDRIPFPMIGRGNDPTHWWYPGTHNQDYQEVAIWRLPYVLTRPDCHFYTRYRCRYYKSAVVQTYHRTCFFKILTYFHSIFSYMGTFSYVTWTHYEDQGLMYLFTHTCCL